MTTRQQNKHGSRYARSTGCEVDVLESRFTLSAGGVHAPVDVAALAAAAGPNVNLGALPAAAPQQAAPSKGSGLVLDSLTGLSLPIVGDLGNVLTIDQAIITNIKPVEDAVGQIVGLEVSGVVNGVLSATGVQVNEQFTSTLDVTSSGPGQTNVVTLDLGGLNLNALGLVTADVPAATVNVKASGAVGTLLGNLGNLLGGLTGAAGGLVNAINQQI